MSRCAGRQLAGGAGHGWTKVPSKVTAQTNSSGDESSLEALGENFLKGPVTAEWRCNGVVEESICAVAMAMAWSRVSPPDGRGDPAEPDGGIDPAKPDVQEALSANRTATTAALIFSIPC